MGLSLVNMLGLSSSVHFAHIACYWKFFLLHYTQVPCQSRLCKADHAYLTYLMLQRQLSRVNCRKLESESESYVTTDGQSDSLSWNKAPIWGLRPDFYYCRTVAGLLMWSALSDERLGLSFVYPAGSSQGSHSRVPVPWDSRPYVTVSDLRLPFSSPPTTRRVTVEVFDPVSTRVS
jgi:hypothetical protein